MTTCRLLFATMCAAAGAAYACSPGQNIDIAFARNDARLTAEQVRRLADFSIRTRLDYPHHDFLGIAGIASHDERQAKVLARQRALAVRQYFERTGYRRAPMEIYSQVRRAGGQPGSESLHRTEVMLAPKPPHGCAADPPG